MKKEDKEKKEEEDGVVFEDEEEVANPNVTIKRLREKLRACEKEKIEYLTGWQKAKAEFINLRKKDEEERVDFIKFAKIDFVKDLIPILDNFENAFKSEHIMGAGKEWKNGIESIFNQIV
ncbi:MAG: nucleotide exchange factor GrpE, partial [Candidatus Zambryskibacteria bacterium CG_4_9_14_3_um_filter_40_16]